MRHNLSDVHWMAVQNHRLSSAALAIAIENAVGSVTVTAPETNAVMLDRCL